MNKIYLLAREEFLGSLRSRWLIIYSLSYLLLAISISPFSLSGLNILGMKAVGKVLSSLINLSLYLVPLISLSMSAISIVGDRETNFMEWIFSKPINEFHYVMGKFLGLSAALSLATLIGFGLASWFVILFLPPEDVTKYFQLILIAITLALVFIPLGLYISNISRTRYQALGTAFFLWFFMVFIFDLFIMGFIESYVKNPLIASLLGISNPVEAIRILMIKSIDPDLTFLGFTGVFILRENLMLVLGFSITILALYAVLFTILTYYNLKKKDLI